MSKFDSIRQGNFAFTFKNGARVSIFIGAGSWSSNRDLSFDTRLKTGYENGKMESFDAEVMVTGSQRLEDWMSKEFGDNPAGYLDPKEVLRILSRASRSKP